MADSNPITRVWISLHPSNIDPHAPHLRRNEGEDESQCVCVVGGGFTADEIKNNNVVSSEQ